METRAYVQMYTTDLVAELIREADSAIDARVPAWATVKIDLDPDARFLTVAWSWKVE